MQEKTSPVFVFATANEITDLPPEILRKGRFDEIFFVDLPALEERSDIFAIHLKKRHRDPANFDLEYLANISEGYSGAEIEQAIIDALFNAYGVKDDIETADIVFAIKKQVPLSRTMRDSVNARRMWAIGRTVNASSATDITGSLQKLDSDDDYKERLFLQYTKLLNSTPTEVAIQVERFYGMFPGRSADAEQMRLYLADFTRLAQKLQEQ